VREGRGSVGRFRVGKCVSESVGVVGGSGSGGCCGDGGSERGRMGGGWGACIYAYGDGNSMITIYDWDGGGGTWSTTILGCLVGGTGLRMVASGRDCEGSEGRVGEGERSL